ncbi:MAG: YIP1 family protein [Acidobacteriaceae bacterium]
MSDSPALPPVESTPPLSQWERLIDTFIAPSKTFTDILRSSSWWLPWLVASIIGLGFVFAVGHQVGWAQVVQNTLHQNPKAMARLQQLSPDQVNAMTVYLVPVGLLLVALVGAAVLWLTINFLFGGQVRFGEMYAVWFYATLPLTLTSILAIITLFAGVDPTVFNMQNPVGTNLGFYLSPDSAPWLINLLKSVDVLKIWTAILLTIGCAKVGRIKTAFAAVVVFGWWILGILISTGFIALMG